MNKIYLFINLITLSIGCELALGQVSFSDDIAPLDGITVKPINSNTANSLDRSTLSQKSKSNNWPDKTIVFIVPFAAGGHVDVIARKIALKLSQSLGQAVLVDNKPGAGGVIGTATAARSLSDGYTFLFTSYAHAVIPSIYSNVPYNSAKDFKPIMLIGTAPVIFATYESARYQSLVEIILQVKQNKADIRYGSTGKGSLSLINIEALANSQNIKLNQISYKGEALMMGDLLSGKIDLVATSLVSLMPHIRSGRVKPLAVSGNKRLASLPQLPTLSELGLGDMQHPQWWAIFAPIETPNSIVLKMNQSLDWVLNDSLTSKQLSETLGVDIVSSTPDFLHKWNLSEMNKLRKIFPDNKFKND
jgi:tripartite-type tricarboxylate transporter receptor subunit TctC